MYMYVLCVSGAPGGQKRVLDLLKLELQTVVRNLIGLLRAESGFSERVESVLKPPNSLSCYMVSILNFISSSEYFH